MTRKHQPFWIYDMDIVKIQILAARLDGVSCKELAKFFDYAPETIRQVSSPHVRNILCLFNISSRLLRKRLWENVEQYATYESRGYRM